jgi:hypothetical protein
VLTSAHDSSRFLWGVPRIPTTEELRSFCDALTDRVFFRLLFSSSCLFPRPFGTGLGTVTPSTFAQEEFSAFPSWVSLDWGRTTADPLRRSLHEQQQKKVQEDIVCFPLHDEKGLLSYPNHRRPCRGYIRVLVPHMPFRPFPVRKDSFNANIKTWDDNLGNPRLQISDFTFGEFLGIVFRQDGQSMPTLYVDWTAAWANKSRNILEERASILDVARSLTEVHTETTSDTHSRQKQKEPGGTRPGDIFNARATWGKVLDPHGWVKVFERSGVGYWRRPGKDRGVSATTNYAGSDLLYVFSTSTDFDSEHGYSKFRAYTRLNHNGDFVRAAEDLLRQGYYPNGDNRSQYSTGASSSTDETGQGATTQNHDPIIPLWPELEDAALYGLAGDIVKTIDPYTEADKVAVLLNVLTAFGNCINSAPHARVQHDNHPARLFVVQVGDTSKGRKGTGWSTPRYLFSLCDEDWSKPRVKSGLSSGEGLIYNVRDPRYA